MTKFGGRMLKITNVFFVVIYLSACLIPILPAGQFWWIAVLGLAFPFLFIIVTIFFTWWLIARSGWCLLSLIALALSWQQIRVMAGLNMRKEFTLSKPTETLRVLTWNISGWGETNKSHTDIMENRSLMLDFFKKQQADVLCFQEYWDKEKKYSNIQAFRDMGYNYSYFVRTSIGDRIIKTGVTILSKYPMTDTAKFKYGEGDFAEHLIYADIEFNHKKVRIFTTHLQSNRLENSEYSAIRKMRRTDENGLKSSKSIVRKLKYAYGYRGTEADLVKQKIKESPYPVIVCGDFNDVPNSYTYFTIKGDLQDTFLEKGTGLGRTFQYLSPTLRIDFILVDKNFEVAQFNRIKVPYSDHYPIVTDLNFALD